MRNDIFDIAESIEVLSRLSHGLIALLACAEEADSSPRDALPAILKTLHNVCYSQYASVAIRYLLIDGRVLRFSIGVAVDPKTATVSFPMKLRVYQHTVAEDNKKPMRTYEYRLLKDW